MPLQNRCQGIYQRVVYTLIGAAGSQVRLFKPPKRRHWPSNADVSSVKWRQWRRDRRLVVIIDCVECRAAANCQQNVNSRLICVYLYLPMTRLRHGQFDGDVPKRKLRFPGHQISWMSECVSDWVRDFSPWVSLATEAAKKRNLIQR